MFISTVILQGNQIPLDFFIQGKTCFVAVISLLDKSPQLVYDLIAPDRQGQYPDSDKPT